jgi:acetyl-CoA acetyltransferase
MSSLARDVAVVGVGYSALTRVGVPNPRQLTFDSMSAALDDAGLTGADVDGIFEYKFGPDSPTAQEAARLIGAPDLAAFADIMATGPSGLASALAGVMAVASGVCETVVVFRTITREAGYMGGIVGGGEAVRDHNQFLTPYGYVGGIIVNMALTKRRWLAQYGRTEEDFGRIAINARRWSALNPRAMLRDPLTIDDYLASRTIADPLRLLDCDYPINGSVATVITTAERARDLRHRPVIVDSMSYGTGRQADWVFGADYLYGGTITCGERMWSRASVTPDDVDFAQIYDGFTMVTAQWIEALGFCPIGEFGPWIGDGSRIGPGGDLPVNTAGGQLAEGRLHGISFLNEAVLQLRGGCGARQVDGAEVGVVASGLYPQCGSMVLLAS